MVMAHDPATVAPLRRQAVADIAKECAPTFVTAVSPQANLAWMNAVAAAGTARWTWFCGLIV
jgi:hypothetical protein